MTYRTHIRKPMTLMAATAAIAAVMSGAPAAAAADKQAPSETSSGETMDAFADWAQKQAKVLDGKLDEATSKAKEAGADAADEVKEEWREARAAIDRQRDALNQQILSLIHI